jgi:hypothetical protein
MTINGDLSISYGLLDVPVVTIPAFPWTRAATVTTVLWYSVIGTYVIMSSQKTSGNATASERFDYNSTLIPTPRAWQAWEICVQTSGVYNTGIMLYTGTNIRIYATSQAGLFSSGFGANFWFTLGYLI